MGKFFATMLAIELLTGATAAQSVEAPETTPVLTITSPPAVPARTEFVSLSAMNNDLIAPNIINSSPSFFYACEGTTVTIGITFVSQPQSAIIVFPIPNADDSFKSTYTVDGTGQTVTLYYYDAPVGDIYVTV